MERPSPADPPVPPTCCPPLAARGARASHLFGAPQTRKPAIVSAPPSEPGGGPINQAVALRVLRELARDDSWGSPGGRRSLMQPRDGRGRLARNRRRRRPKQTEQLMRITRITSFELAPMANSALTGARYPSGVGLGRLVRGPKSITNVCDKCCCCCCCLRGRFRSSATSSGRGMLWQLVGVLLVAFARLGAGAGPLAETRSSRRPDRRLSRARIGSLSATDYINQLGSERAAFD